MKRGFVGLLAAGIVSSGYVVASENEDLFGYTDGAEVVEFSGQRQQIDTISGVVYSQVIGTRAVRQLEMSLMIPRNDKLKPAIVYYPGGGFFSADHEKFTEMRTALANAGYVVAAAQYRVVPDKFPALVQDGKAAIRYLRAHAEQYGIDPERIAVLGDSAGGYMAQMMAMMSGEAEAGKHEFDAGDFLNVSSDVQAAVSLYGISNLLNIGAGHSEAIQDVHDSKAVTEALLVNGMAFGTYPGASIGSNEEKALHASPMGHLKGNKPALLLMHGSSDNLVSPIQSAQLFEALKERGQDVDYLLVKGAAHGDLVWYQQPVVDTVVKWFKENLGEPKAAAGKASDSANDHL